MLKFCQKKKIKFRLDYHGVVDLLDNTMELQNKDDICVISFLGRKSMTRINTRQDIITRIQNNQINFGILVFKRGDDKFQKNGSKAWINKILDYNDSMIFIDDSSDHCKSVESLGLKNMIVINFDKRNKYELLNILENY